MAVKQERGVVGRKRGGSPLSSSSFRGQLGPTGCESCVCVGNAMGLEKAKPDTGCAEAQMLATNYVQKSFQSARKC